MDNENTDYKTLKEDHHWTTEEKMKFLGYGEWIEEADSFHFEYSGYEAIVSRMLAREPLLEQEVYFGGHLCGYIKIPEDHPWYRKKNIDLECHGGITCNEIHEEHWIGFDCAHSMDKVPTMEYLRRNHPALIEAREMIPERLRSHPIFNRVYRNMRYCIKECISVIKQLMEASELYAIKKSNKGINGKKGK